MKRISVFLIVLLVSTIFLVSGCQSTPQTPSVEPPVAPTEEPTVIPAPTPSGPQPVIPGEEEPTPNLEPPPASIPEIEVEWETGGPYGERPRLSDGINGLLIDSEDGSVVRAIEYLAVWQTANGGETWERQNRNLTQEEMEVFDTPLSTDTIINSRPVWKGWENLVTQFPSLRGRFTGACPSIDSNNSNNTFVAIAIPANFVFPGFPDERPSRLKEFPYHGIITRLFLSLDGNQTFREITAPPSDWIITWRKDAEGKITYTTEHNLKAGATAIVSYKGNLKLYVGLAQGWYDPTFGEYGDPSIVWQTILPIASLLD